MKPTDSPGKKWVAAVDDCMGKGLVDRVFAGAALGVAFGPPTDRQISCQVYGLAMRRPTPRPVLDNTLFDLASLTKPLATTLAVLCLIGRQRIHFDQPLASLLHEPVPADKQAITLAQLLGHCSGLPPHQPYYETLQQVPPAQRKQAVLQALLNEPLLYRPGTETRYSDLGFMLLGLIIEQQSGIALNRFVATEVIEPLGLGQRLLFQPLDFAAAARLPAERFAATEDCPWRHKVLCGEVHDDNAWVLGGVAGHAGLFGDIHGVLGMAVAILDQWKGRASHPGYRHHDLRHILVRQPIPGSTWSLGFDTVSPRGSSAGRFFSPHSIGHLGFTGTSLWIDPDRDLVVVLLTNRVHPQRNNDAIKAFRPQLHDLVVSALLPAD